jgi:hypothetical protein
MSSVTKRSSSKHHPLASAPDILARSQNWVQKVSSIRLSNMRVGQHFTDVGHHLSNMLADKDPTHSNIPSKHMRSDTFHPSFCKLLKTRAGGFLVFVGGNKSGVRIWLTSSCSHSQTEFSTSLLHDSPSSDLACLDLCFAEEKDDSTAGKVIVYLLLAPSASSRGSSRGSSGRHTIRPLTITGRFSASPHPHSPPQVAPLPLGDQQYDGAASAITCTNRFLLVSHPRSGTVHLLCRSSLQKVGVVPSLGVHRPVVLAASARWMAIQSKS